ncbi:aminotransferase class V-fold PLP-dependent enzyme [Marinobacterium jannaschii]|uniref:aminotransferase class V-fold PLP-dependent enzyme n=1 Tax=Marinobacterium jannaschii TaxID=64970 RepID=UPI000483E55A|nr:aminotransferase class V-fold PLP-dependent enzyme [Marinobacterium jannaschii]
MSLSLESLQQAVLGEAVPLQTPFGTKPLIYADYTASGRSLRFIEDFIRQKVLPYYANTHSEASFTGRQTSALRDQARQQVRQALNGGPQHKVIFCGSGATAAIDKLIDLLSLRLPAALDQRYGFSAQIPESERAVVFIGPYEHHSNELPWRESITTLVTIPLDAEGLPDQAELERQLQHYADRPLKLGSFSAASNVTGIKSDVPAITALLQRHGALAFWDYAAAGPYVRIDLQDSGADGLFLSPHKFIGGPGTPGILVLNEAVLSNSVPAVPGGGTVLYVTPEDHRYVADIERREEGGTPAIVESIRAGLVFRLQQQIGPELIEQREHRFIRRALERWAAHPAVEVLGGSEAERLSICSLQIHHQGKPLHYSFVVALLNDLFGIQARGGCSCAGPYGHHLLGLDMTRSKALESRLLAGDTMLRPGWVRLNFNYFIDEATFDYLLSAIELVAQHGWRLLPYYCFDRSAGVWRYQGESPALPVSLDDAFSPSPLSSEAEIAEKPDLMSLLADAEAELLRFRPQQARFTLDLAAESEALCWFRLPQEIVVG